MAETLTGPRARQAIAYFQSQGWPPAQAAGIAANLHAESKFDPDAYGDNTLAYGIAQWHHDRQEAFRKWAGSPIQGSSFEKQLEFIHHELTDGAWKKAGEALRATDTPEMAGSVVSRRYDVPADRYGESVRRGIKAWDLSQATRAST